MKILYEQRDYSKDAHGHGREGTRFDPIGIVACCSDAANAWQDGNVFDFNEYEGDFSLSIFEEAEGDHEGGCYSDTHHPGIRFCPWCAAKISFERAKHTRVEYDCNEIIEKRMVCNEVMKEIRD